MATAGAIEPEVGIEPSPGAGPLQAVVWLSAARCTVTYVAGPALGSIGAVAALVGPVAVWLHLIATGCVWLGTRRMWRARRRGRVAYTALAVAVTFVSVVGIARALG